MGEETKLVPFTSAKPVTDMIIVCRETNEKYKILHVGRLHFLDDDGVKLKRKQVRAQFGVPANAAILGRLIVIQSTKGGKHYYAPADNKKIIQFITEFDEYRTLFPTDDAIFNPDGFGVLPSRRRLTSLERIIRGAQQFEELKRSQGLI